MYFRLVEVQMDQLDQKVQSVTVLVRNQENENYGQLAKNVKRKSRLKLAPKVHLAADAFRINDVVSKSSGTLNSNEKHSLISEEFIFVTLFIL